MKRGQTSTAVRELREAVMIRARGRCEWPKARVEALSGGTRVVPCGVWARQMAHLHSRGMGGSVAADDLANVMAACDLHARVTDGGGWDAQTATFEMFRVVGYEGDVGVGSLAWHRAEALRAHLETATRKGSI